MAKGKDEEFEKEYAELKLQYALENSAIRNLFDEFIKLHEKLYQSIEVENKPIFSIKDPSNPYSRTWDALVDKLAKIGISYYDTLEAYDSYCHVLRKEKNADLFFAYGFNTVYIKSKHRRFTFQSNSSEDNSKIREIFLRKSFEKDEQYHTEKILKEKDEKWFMGNYENFNLIEEYERHDYLDSFKSEVLDKKTKKFYSWLRSYKKIYSEDSNNYTFLEKDVLKDGKYLNLQINLNRKIEDIEKDLKETIKYFKSIVDDISPDAKTKARRQDIKLYKQYLRVYKLVQKKGEKWTEIAKEVFPKDFKNEDELSEFDSDQKPESAIAKVHQYNKEAKRLIAEGLP